MRRQIIAIVIGVCLVIAGFFLYPALSSFSGPLSDLSFYPGSPQPYSYILDTNGTDWFAFNGTTGYNTITSNNCSEVIETVIAANTSIFFRPGEYPISVLHPINVNYLHFIGSGWDTVFLVSANAGFNISHTDSLYSISFENIRWRDANYASAVADYGITSAMTEKRINNFAFRNCRVEFFRKVGTIFLELVNGEECWIENNIFWHTRTAFIRLEGRNYESGNIRIRGNAFFAGYDTSNENHIQLLAGDNSTATCAIGSIYSWGNHFLGEDYGANCTAWNCTTVGGKLGDVKSTDDRYEKCQILMTNSYNNTYDINRIEFKGALLWTDQASTAFFFDTYTRQCLIAESSFQQATGTLLLDEHISQSERNSFINNFIVATAFFNASKSTIVRGNINLNPLGQAESNHCIGSSDTISYWGYTATPTTAHTYDVETCAVLINVTGGTDVNVTIYDADSNVLLIDQATLEWFPVAWGYKVRFEFTSAPTVVCEFE